MNTPRTRGRWPVLSAATALMMLSGCENGFDFDLRGAGGGFSTATAAQSASGERPEPDNRGVISYPNYQVAIARNGDTVSDVAARVGTDAASLAAYNGVAADAPLRSGEVIALPARVSEPSPATGAIGTGPIQPSQVDVTTLAGQAIDNAEPTPVAEPAALPPAQTGAEPIRHKVVRGETAFSISRLYKVTVRDLARWNGLGPQFAVREGQFLLIPVGTDGGAPEGTTANPGEGSVTPPPPSSGDPLPEDPPLAASAIEQEPDIGAQTQPVPGSSNSRFGYPISGGTIVRDYVKGRNEGLNIKGAPGADVFAAGGGTVAAITESSEGVPIIVLRHSDNLLTVYANVTDVTVKKGDAVRRGQPIAVLRDGEQSFVHFEVRDGFDSVDPNQYLG